MLFSFPSHLRVGACLPTRTRRPVAPAAAVTGSASCFPPGHCGVDGLTVAGWMGTISAIHLACYGSSPSLVRLNLEQYLDFSELTPSAAYRTWDAFTIFHGWTWAPTCICLLLPYLRYLAKDRPYLFSAGFGRSAAAIPPFTACYRAATASCWLRYGYAASNCRALPLMPGARNRTLPCCLYACWACRPPSRFAYTPPASLHLTFADAAGGRHCLFVSDAFAASGNGDILSIANLPHARTAAGGLLATRFDCGFCRTAGAPPCFFFYSAGRGFLCRLPIACCTCLPAATCCYNILPAAWTA